MFCPGKIKNFKRMKSSILISSAFLIFLMILIKAPVNSSRNTKLHEIVTDALIHEICPQTRNPNLCEYILNQFKGKPLFPKPFAAVMRMAQLQAKTTAEKIWGLENDIKDDKSELKLRYHKCLERYRNAMVQLKEANRFVHAGNITSVKRYTSLAMSEVQSCDQELAKQHEPSNLAKDNRKSQELCSVILAICDKLVHDPHNHEIKD